MDAVKRYGKAARKVTQMCEKWTENTALSRPIGMVRKCRLSLIMNQDFIYKKCN
jgi:hypothetical protein